MSLPDVLLSLLRMPMSGTELIRLFDGTIRHFWNTDLSQIYRALEGLEREGCVRSRSVPSPRGPDRKVYRLTAKGGRRLTAWIRSAPRVPAAKFEYLAQLFSMTASDRPREDALALLQSMRNEAVEAVAVLTAIDETARGIPGYPEDLPAHVFYPWLTLRHGLLRRRAFLEWIDECREHLGRRSAKATAGLTKDGLEEMVRLLRLIDG